ncbi:hypothetical protein [Vibrio hepatarius]|uniref:hypothetical protein n=1 Tax=Vibrio hepatarius TaxID=171383 RepID=UPI001C092A6E|nr:hypothetical protein [Vibrio hepatarius]MBU2896159.1 hypothetical protein [Vibrio hepatarius]
MLEIAKDVSGDIGLLNFESQVQELFRLLNLGISKIESKQATGPKFSVEPFLYRNELSKCNIPKYGHTCEEAITALSTIVEGSLRPQSSNEVYNMVPQPTSISPTYWQVFMGELGCQYCMDPTPLVISE